MAKINSIAVNLAKKYTDVNLCKILKVSKGEKVTILYPGSLVSVAGRLWSEGYLEFDYEIEDMVSWECYQLF